MGVGIEFFPSNKKIRASKSDVLIYSGAGYEARTRFPASRELRSAIRRNPASPLIKMRFAHGCRYRVLFVNEKNQGIQSDVLIYSVMLYHCRFLNPRLKNTMCKSEFSVLF